MVFADTGPTGFSYDPLEEAACADALCPPEPSADQYDPIIKQYNLADTNYRIEAFDSYDAELTMPLMIFYETGGGELTIFKEEDVTVEKSEDKFIVLRVYEDGGELKRHIILFQVSGLPEEYDNVY